MIVFPLFALADLVDIIAMLVASALQALPDLAPLPVDLLRLGGVTLLCREVAVCLCRIRFVRQTGRRRACRRLAMIAGAGAFLAVPASWSSGQSLAVAMTAAWCVVLVSTSKGARREP